MDAFDLILTLGLSARATRFAVYDDAGRLLRRPLERAGRLVAGKRGAAFAEDLTMCPFCIGFWLSLAAATTWAAYGHTTVWTVIALAATCSYVAGHAAATLDGNRYGSW